MAGKGLNVKDLSEIRRLKNLAFSNRQIAKSLGIHRNTVNKYLEESESNKPKLVETEKILSTSPLISDCWTDQVDWEKVKEEYLKGVSLQVIYDELQACGKVQIQYPGFWKQLQKRAQLSKVTMIRTFKPGERIEIDYCDGIDILDPVTGEIKKTELFVGVLCQSRYAFAEFTWTQRSEDFLSSHVNMFSYFGGTAQVLSPDNLKSAVTKTHRYDPVINPSYTRLASHYDVAVVPARVKTPQDKAIVERTIQIFQRWFYAVVRNRTFTSLFELNKVLKEHLELFNNKIHRIFKKTRTEMFLLERKFLRKLPENPYEVASYKKVILGRDCHFVLEKNYYSAPYQHREKELDVWFTNKKVEIFFEGERIGYHRKLRGEGNFLTDPAHYPESHKAYAEEDIQRLLKRSQMMGPKTEILIHGLLAQPAPYRYFRRCQGILALAGKYSKALLEEACENGLRFNNTSPRHLEGVIKMRKGVQRKNEDPIKRAENPNLRGVSNIH